MIIEYFVLLFNTLVCQIGDIIDSGFINSIGLEAICISGILSSIKVLFRPLYMYGDYYYRLNGKRGKACFYFTILTGAAMSLFFFLIADFVPLVYKIEAQYEPLLVQCIRITALTFIFEAVDEQLNSYMIYSGQGKMRSVINFVYYAAMILLDIIAVVVFHSIPLVIVFTGICLFACDIVSYKLCGMNKETYAKGDFKYIIMDTFPFFIGQCLSHLSTSLINIFATKLGTIDYAVLVVCRKAVEFGQNCLSPIEPMSVTKFRGARLKYKELMYKLKPVLVAASFIFLSSCFAVALAIKGDLSVLQLAAACAVSCVTSLPTYLFFKLGHTILMMEGRGRMIGRANFVRLIITLVLCGSSMIFGLWPLLMYSTIVDLLLSIYIYKHL